MKIVILLFFFASAVLAENNIAIPVLASETEDNSQAKELTSRITASLIKTNQFKVMDSELIEILTKSQGINTECNDNDCFISIGEAVGTDYLMYGSYTSSAIKSSITLTVIRLEDQNLMNQKKFLYGTDVLAVPNYMLDSDVKNLLAFTNSLAPENLYKQSAIDTVATIIAPMDTFASTVEPQPAEAAVDTATAPMNKTKDLVADNNSSTDKTKKISFTPYVTVISQFNGPAAGAGGELLYNLKGNHYLGVEAEGAYIPDFFYNQNMVYGVGLSYMYGNIIKKDKVSLSVGLALGYWYFQNKKFNADRDNSILTKYIYIGGPKASLTIIEKVLFSMSILGGLEKQEGAKYLGMLPGYVAPSVAVRTSLGYRCNF